MKECPICKAVSFDDMDVCFGCLYNFEANPTQGVVQIEGDEPMHSPSSSSPPNYTPPKPSAPLLQSGVGLDGVEQKHERGAHRKREELSFEIPTAPEQRLVIIPLDSVSSKDDEAAEGKSGYRIEINVVCV